MLEDMHLPDLLVTIVPCYICGEQRFSMCKFMSWINELRALGIR